MTDDLKNDEVNPEPPVPRGNPDMPDLRNWGGLRTAKKALRRSATIMANREAIAYQILAMLSTKITDVMSWDEDGNIKLVPSKKLKENDHVVAMIKGVKATYHKDGKIQSMEVMLYDRVAVARLAGLAAGLFAKDTEDDKPSVVGMKVVGPKKRKVRTLENKP